MWKYPLRMSIGVWNLLNFMRVTDKFHNCHYTSILSTHAAERNQEWRKVCCAPIYCPSHLLIKTFFDTIKSVCKVLFSFLPFTPFFLQNGLIQDGLATPKKFATSIIAWILKVSILGNILHMYQYRKWILEEWHSPGTTLRWTGRLWHFFQNWNHKR